MLFHVWLIWRMPIIFDVVFKFLQIYIMDFFGIWICSSGAMIQNAKNLICFVPTKRHTSLTYLVVQQDLSVWTIQGSGLHNPPPQVTPEETILCEIDGQAARRHEVGACNDNTAFSLQRCTFHHRVITNISPEQLPQNKKEHCKKETSNMLHDK